MLRKTVIPNKPRFSLVRQRAYDLLANLDICKFPVDPREIIRCFPEWHLVGWFELHVNTGVDDPLYLDRDKAEAKTVIQRGTNDYLIVYDERVDNPQRIRWTLAHEIGHIVMGHLTEFDATALSRRGLTEKEHSVLEVEAHCFAAELLAPKTIISRFDFHNSPQGISLICDISKDAAEKRLKQIKQADYGYYPSEVKILRNFYKHLAFGEFYQVVHNTACRFFPSSIYPELCKECRICKNCNSFITDDTHRYCPVCGSEVPEPYMYSPYKPHKGMFVISNISDIHSELYMQGKQYYEIPMKDDKLLYCPVCKNYGFSNPSGKCTKCGAPTTNHCTAENRILPGNCRFCPYCGSEATFKKIYDILPERLSVNNVKIPDVYDDYIECEYWPFVVMTVGMWEKAMDLYVALEDSIAIYDGDDMIIFVRGSNEQVVATREANTILACLSNNGLLPIKQITVMIAEPIMA